MDSLALTESYIYHITSPVVVVDDQGNHLWGNETGNRHFDSTLILAESVIPHLPLSLNQLTASLLKDKMPCWVSTTGAIVKISPLAEGRQRPRLL